MDIAEEHAAPRIHERSKPARPPWTYRCRLIARSVLIDVDAFGVEEAMALAGTHWGVGRDRVAVDGKRRRWMRWMRCSTHDARDGLPMERSWWYATKFGAMVVTALAAAYLVHATLL